MVARYRGLSCKTFAVIVTAEQALRDERPDIVPQFTREIARRLADPRNRVGATGCVPADEVLTFEYEHPGWVSMAPSTLAEKLKVQRLVFVELCEYRLTDAGGPRGFISGCVRVWEDDSDTAEKLGFQECVRVGYPDDEGFSTLVVPRTTAEMALELRFTKRVVWRFFDHSEPTWIRY